MPVSISGDGTLTGVDPAASGFGNVLQVKSQTKTDVFTSTSTSFVDITGLSVSITPSSANSKILVISSITGASNPYSYVVGLRMLRDSTPICVGDSATNYHQSSIVGIRNSFDVNTGWHVSMNYLDAPSSTSALTYKIQGRIEAGTFKINTSGSDSSGSNWSYRAASTITVIEVAA